MDELRSVLGPPVEPPQHVWAAALTSAIESSHDAAELDDLIPQDLPPSAAPEPDDGLEDAGLDDLADDDWDDDGQPNDLNLDFGSDLGALDPGVRADLEPDFTLDGPLDHAASLDDPVPQDTQPANDLQSSDDPEPPGWPW